MSQGVGMAYITEYILRLYAAEQWMREKAEQNVKNYFSRSFKTIYLSHGARDRELAQGLVNYLATLGAELYVDWNDSYRQRVTGRESAERVKNAIRENEFFLVLASQNGLNSKWVHWEIGIAEQCKPPSRIAIVPVADPMGEFPAPDYLQLYRSLEIDDENRIKLFDVGRSKQFDMHAWFFME